MTGGLQCVLLNLRFDSEAARGLGFEGHHCELQLTTSPFAALAQVTFITRP